MALVSWDNVEDTYHVILKMSLCKNLGIFHLPCKYCNCIFFFKSFQDFMLELRKPVFWSDGGHLQFIVNLKVEMLCSVYFHNAFGQQLALFSPLDRKGAGKVQFEHEPCVMSQRELLPVSSMQSCPNKSTRQTAEPVFSLHYFRMQSVTFPLCFLAPPCARADTSPATQRRRSATECTAANFMTSQQNKHHDSRKAGETPVSTCRLTSTLYFLLNQWPRCPFLVLRLRL